MREILVCLALLSGFDTPPAMNDPDVQVAARNFRVAIYEKFHTDRERYDVLRQQGDDLLCSWVASHEPAQLKAEVIAWYETAQHEVEQNADPQVSASPALPKQVVATGASDKSISAARSSDNETNGATPSTTVADGDSSAAKSNDHHPAAPAANVVAHPATDAAVKPRTNSVGAKAFVGAIGRALFFAAADSQPAETEPVSETASPDIRPAEAPADQDLTPPVVELPAAPADANPADQAEGKTEPAAAPTDVPTAGDTDDDDADDAEMPQPKTP